MSKNGLLIGKKGSRNKKSREKMKFRIRVDSIQFQTTAGTVVLESVLLDEWHLFKMLGQLRNCL